MIATFWGNLGQDPKKGESNGKVYAHFSVAERVGKDETKWRNCTAWGKDADNILKYFQKGSGITVVGRSSYTKKDDKEYENFSVLSYGFGSRPNPKAEEHTEDTKAKEVSSSDGSPLDDVPF